MKLIIQGHWSLLFLLCFNAVLSTAATKFVFEGCEQAFFLFERADPAQRADPLVIRFAVASSSTATEGEDFVALPPSVTIASNETQVILTVNVISDALREGVETLILEVEDDCNCTVDVEELRIYDVEPLSIIFEPMEVCPGEPFVINPVIKGGLPEYNYLWSTGQRSASISLSLEQSSTIALDLVDGCGNVATNSISIEVKPKATVRFASDNICVSRENAGIPLEVEGLGPWQVNYRQQGQPETLTQEISSDHPTLSVTEDGTYTLVSVLDQEGCSGLATGAAKVRLIDLNIESKTTATTCFGGTDGAVELNISGGSRPYRFQWDQGLPNRQNHNNLKSGSYTVVVRDAAGCTVQSQLTVPSPPAIKPSIRLRGADCTLSSSHIDLSVAGGDAPYTYQWSHLTGNIEDPPTVTPGTYSVQVTDATGCTATASITVVEPNEPVVQLAAIENLNCRNPQGGSIDIEVSDGTLPFTYRWDNGGGDVEDPANLPAGQYKLELTDAIGCVTSISAEVQSDFVTPEVRTVERAAMDCPSTGVRLQGLGSSVGPRYSYLWETETGLISEGADGLSPLVNAPGEYFLTVLNMDNGCSATERVLVELAEGAPFVQFDPVLEPFTCNTGQLGISANSSGTSPQSQYFWRGETPEAQIEADGLQAQVDRGGKYYLSIHNPQSGCRHTDSLVVPVDTLGPLISTSPNGEINCHNTEVTLRGQSTSNGHPMEHRWSNEEGLILNNVASDSITVQKPGLYYYTVTDLENGCSSTDEMIVINNSPNDLILLARPPRCAGERAEFEIIDVVGGVEPYHFSINQSSLSQKQYYSNLETGTYHIEVRDAMGCSFTEQLHIPTVEAMHLELEGEVQLSLGERFSPQALINVDESELKSIRWYPPDFLSCSDCLNPEIQPTSSIDYELRVTNQNGCTVSEKLSLRVNKQYQVYFPNAFRPYHTNGANAFFFVQARGDLVREVRNFQVIDRWGTLLHEARHFMPNDPAFGWDGRYHGQRIPPGILLYRAEIEFIDGEVEIFTGDVALLD